jgi:hypothetical protein
MAHRVYVFAAAHASDPLVAITALSVRLLL